MSFSPDAMRVYRVLRDSGPRKLNVVQGLIGRRATTRDLHRVVGELFIIGCVRWVGAKKGRQLGARKP